jgi:uncharacterized protein YhaN
MRLIECYVENFGKLSAFRYTFKDGLNVIKAENGFGKTTLTVFLKTMLYGIDDNKKKDIADNERKHYRPWGGGKFGGTLTFSAKGRIYRIERSFGAKPSDDTFCIYDVKTEQRVTDFTENLGFELFKIDAEGFERTVFLSERRLSAKNDNKTISAKLSDLVGADGDVGGLDEAIKLLEEKRKYYKLKRGSAGLLNRLSEELGELENKINDLLRLKDTIPGEQEAVDAKAREVWRLEKEKQERQKDQIRESYESQYLSLAERLKEKRARLEELKRFFKDGVPTEEQISSAYNAGSEAKRLLAESEGEIEDSGDELSEIGKLIDTVNTVPLRRNVKKRWHLFTAFALAMLAIGCALGAMISPIFYTGCAAFAIFAALAILNARAISAHKKSASAYREPQEYIKRTLGIEIAASDVLATLNSMRTGVLAKCEQQRAKKREREAKLARADSLMRDYEEFISKFDITLPDPISEIRAKCTRLEFLSAETAAEERSLSEYATKYGIDTATVGAMRQKANIGEIEQALHTARQEFGRAETNLEYLRARVAELDALNAMRDELTEKLGAANEEYDTVLLTIEHLERAKDALTTRYLGKTKAAFSEYIEALKNESADSFTMNTKFGVMRFDFGESKPSELYSLGTRDFYELCTRLALTDSLYEDESPFIILDDPFAHFDDVMCERALIMLKKLGAKKQILYLTCSSARAF